MDENEYRQDLFVDPCNLDKEWNRNGVLAGKWAERSAQADYDLKMAEQNYKITKALIEAKVRSSPEDYGLPEKVTESMITMAVRIHEDYKKASEEHANAIKTAKILNEAKDAMKFQRVAACKGLTSLWVFQYGNVQRVQRDINEAFANPLGDELDAHMDKYQSQTPA